MNPMKTANMPTDGNNVASDSEEELDEDSPAEDEQYDLDQVKEFIMRSFAMRALCDKLQSFIYPTFYSGLKELVREWSSRVSDGSQSQNRVVHAFLSDLQDISPSLITISKDNDNSWFNQTKLCIEGWTREKWDWWPLRSPKIPLTEGHTRVKWHDVSLKLLRCDDVFLRYYRTTEKRDGRNYLRISRFPWVDC
jgi:hypothetical protein